MIRRLSHNSPHFYQNQQLELYAAKFARPLTLRQLVNELHRVSVLQYSPFLVP
jgi:hypothetical protein